MPSYQIRRFMRPDSTMSGVRDDVEAIEARDEAEAVAIAQALAAEPDDALLAIELRDEAERVL